MHEHYGCWRRYVWVILTQLGFRNASEIRLVIANVIRVLRKEHYDFLAAFKKLAGRCFRNSPEQRQTTRALREVIQLERGDGLPRRNRRTISLGDHDPAVQEIKADPALLIHQEQLQAEAMAALDSLPEQDRQLICKRVIEGRTYRDLAAELGMSVGSLHNRVEELKITLAVLIVQSRNKNRRV